MPPNTRAVVLLNRDLRLHDHPALTAAAARFDQVVPLFVLDERLSRSDRIGPNRARFLCESLSDLRATLRAGGGELYVRRGDPATEAVKVTGEVGARAILVSEDVSRRAQEREHELRRAASALRLEFETYPGATVVPPDVLRTSGGGHYRVLTPYWRAWKHHPRRSPLPPARRIRSPAGLAGGPLPAAAESGAQASPQLLAGGETAGRRPCADGWPLTGQL